jgi:hypothetical protein
VLVSADAHSVLRQAATVEGYVEARPIWERASAADARLVGSFEEQQLEDVASLPEPDLHSEVAMPSLSETVNRTLRKLRPELTPAQLDAAVKVTVADMEKDEVDNSESGKAVVAAAIADAIDKAGPSTSNN